MSELKKFRGEDYLCDNREFEFKPVDGGVRVFVDGKWWMPTKPFPVGFDQANAQFDSVENAVAALSMQYGIEQFFDMDEKDQIMDAKTPVEFAKATAKQLESPKPKRKRRLHDK